MVDSQNVASLLYFLYLWHMKRIGINQSKWGIEQYCMVTNAKIQLNHKGQKLNYAIWRPPQRIGIMQACEGTQARMKPIIEFI